MANIKVLIVEDSPLVADLLKQALESDKQVQVVGVASNGQEAIELVPKIKPDLITMDVWMPVLDGFATVEWVMANKPTPILVITSSKLKQDVQISLRMLAAGALDVVEKPALTDESNWKAYRRELTSRVKLLSSVRVITHVRGRTNTAPFSEPSKPKTVEGVTPAEKPNDKISNVTTPKPITPQNNGNNNSIEKKNTPVARLTETPSLPAKTVETPKPKSDSKNGKENNKDTSKEIAKENITSKLEVVTPSIAWPFFPATTHYQVVTIASSTGGPTALLKVLQKLPPNFPCGILIVQHISEGFTQGLVDWLQREIKLKMRVAKDGDIVRPGEILVAPDRRDIVMQPDFKIETRRDSKNILCPNADVMMSSVANVYGRQTIGVVLTGMGNDGAKGLKKIYDFGGYTIAQDEATSLIYGMPRAAVEIGATKESLPLGSIAERLVELLQQPVQPEDTIRPAEKTRS